VVKSNGGFPFTEALRDLVPEGSVIIVAGADWAAMIPLYSERKALMIRNGLEYDEDYLKRAFNDLADEDVSALVLVGDLRKNQNLLNLVVDRFGMDTIPTFSHPMADVYFSRIYIDQVQSILQDSRKYGETSFTPRTAEDKPPNVPFNIPPHFARTAFSGISPAPFRAFFTFGFGTQWVDDAVAHTAHATSDLWLRAPAGASHIVWDFGIDVTAYEREGEKTDGVEFVVTVEPPAGAQRQIFSRLLDPANEPKDRGRQHEVISYVSKPGDVLRFSSRPYLSPNFDWSYWAKIEVK
jgi:hypothetical protein